MTTSVWSLPFFFFFFYIDSDIEYLGSIHCLQVLSLLSFSKSIYIASREIQPKYFSHYLFINWRNVSMVSGFPHIPGSVSHLKRNILNSFIILFELKAQQVYHFSLLTMFLSLCPAEMFFLSEVLIKTFCLPPYLLVLTCLGEVKHNRAILTSETALICWSYFPQVFKKK